MLASLKSSPLAAVKAYCRVRVEGVGKEGEERRERAFWCWLEETREWRAVV